jgi:pimeloyl-ACP methyl ester carboxylesterase
LAELIHEMGFNVINVRLPKHNHGRVQDLNTLTLEDFKSQTRVMSGLGEELGESVVFIGHSAGGNSAIYSAITNPETTSGLITLAPALEVRPSVERWSFLLGRTFITNILLNLPDETFGRYRSLGSGRATYYFAEHLREWRGKENFEGLAQALSYLNVLQLDVLNDGTVSNEVNTEVAEMSGIEHRVFSEDLAHVNMLDQPNQHESGTPQRSDLDQIRNLIIDFLEAL